MQGKQALLFFRLLSDAAYESSLMELKNAATIRRCPFSLQTIPKERGTNDEGGDADGHNVNV